MSAVVVKSEVYLHDGMYSTNDYYLGGCLGAWMNNNLLTYTYVIHQSNSGYVRAHIQTPRLNHDNKGESCIILSVSCLNPTKTRILCDSQLGQ